MFKKVFFVIVFLSLLISTQSDASYARPGTGGGSGGGCPLTCNGTSNICSTNTTCQSNGLCAAKPGCTLINPPASYACNGSSYKEYSASCPTTTPSPTNNKPTVSSTVTFIDQSQNNKTVSGDNYVTYINDTVLAEVNASYVGTISATLSAKDNLNGTTTSQNISSINYLGGGKYGFTFNINPIDSPTTDEVYTYSVKFTVSNVYGSANSNTSSFNFHYPHIYPFKCNTPGSGRLLASNLTGAKDIVLFDNSSSNGCVASSDFASGSGIGQHITAPNNVYNPLAITYNNDEKDSILYYKTGLVQDSQCYPGGEYIDESGQTVFVSDHTNGDIWLVHWCYQPSSVYNTIDTSTIRVMPIIVGTDGSAADMEIDTLNGGNPKYFWYTTQITGTYRVNWSSISTRYDSWKASGFKTDPSPFNASGSLFQNGSSMNGFYSNGTKTVNANTFISIIHNGSNVRGIETYNPNGGNMEGANSTLDLGINGSGFSTPGMVYLQADGAEGGQDLWHIDGMTETPDGNYILASSGGGRLIFVFANSPGSSPKFVGYTVIVGTPDPKPNGGFDGIEIDKTYQLYIADESQGIWSANAGDVITAAQQNMSQNESHIQGSQTYLTPRNWVVASEYVGTPNNENWDDIAPMSGSGSATSAYPNYFNTRMGSVYSDGGFSISSLNSQNDTSNAYFGTYSVLSGTASNIFKYAMTPSGSYYNWEMQSYKSSINPSGNPKYGYNGLYSSLKANPEDTFISYSPADYDSTTTSSSCGMIDANSNLTLKSLSGNNQVYTYNGCLVVDSSNTNNSGINADGIIFVNGNVTIKANPTGNFNSNTNHHLVIVATGNIDIKPANYSSSVNTVMTQQINLGMVADGNITIEPYSTYPDLPNFVEPMVIKGLMVDYTPNTNLNFNIGYLSQWYPAAQINYDPGLVNEFSGFFIGGNIEQEVGL